MLSVATRICVPESWASIFVSAGSISLISSKWEMHFAPQFYSSCIIYSYTWSASQCSVMLHSLELKWQRLSILLQGTLVSHHIFLAGTRNLNFQPRDAAHCIKSEKKHKLKAIIELSLLGIRWKKVFSKMK